MSGADERDDLDAHLLDRDSYIDELRTWKSRSGRSYQRLAAELRRQGSDVGKSTVASWCVGASLPAEALDREFRALLQLLGAGDEDVRRLADTAARLRRAGGRRPRHVRNPWCDLRFYDQDDWDWFFGRELLTDRLLAELVARDDRGGLVVVVGASGAGKSSLLRAGLVAGVAAGRLAIEGSTAWPALVITPGKDPVLRLAEGLAGLSGTDESERIHAALRAAPTSAAEHAAGICEVFGAQRLLLVVDQLEEVFAPEVDADERSTFLTAVAAIAVPPPDVGRDPRPSGVVVVGLRSDFLPDATESLPAALGSGAFVVGPMTEEQLRQVIRKPAEKAGGTVGAGLVEVVLRDLRSDDAHSRSMVGRRSRTSDRSVLPFLAHAMTVLWEQAASRDRALTVTRYEQTGGIHGAVARTADAVFQALDPAQRQLARLLFLRLIRVSTDGPTTLRRMRHDELVDLGDETRSDELTDVLWRFVDARLITVDEHDVEVSHQAVLTSWPELGGWLEEHKADLVIHRALTDAAAGWATSGRDADDLYRAGKLAAVEHLAQPDRERPIRLNAEEREFLAVSLAHQAARTEAERRRVAELSRLNTRLRRLLAVAIVAVLAAVGAGVFAQVQRVEALGQRNAAISGRLAGEAMRLRGSDPALAGQLAMVAYRLAATATSRSSLLDAGASPSETRALGTSTVRQTVAFAGPLMASADADGSAGTLRLWSLADVNHPRVVSAPFRGPSGPILGLALRSDGRVLVAGGADHVLWAWDVSDPARPAPLGAPTPSPEAVVGIDFSPDGRMIVVGGAGRTLQLFDATDPAHLHPIGTGLRTVADIQVVVFSPAGSTVAVGESAADGSGVVQRWDVADPARPLPATAPSEQLGHIFALAISPDGRTMATGGDDRTPSGDPTVAPAYAVRLWDLVDPTGARPMSGPLVGPGGRISHLAFSSDGRSLAAASSDSTAWAWDVTSHHPIAALPHPAIVTAVHFLGSGASHLVTTALDGTVRQWALPGPVITDPTAIVFTAQISSDGRTLLVGQDGNAKKDPTNQKVRLWDITDPRNPVPTSPPLGGTAGNGLSGAAALSNDGRTVAAGTNGGPVYLWDVTHPDHPVQLGDPLTGPTSSIESVAFTRNDDMLAAAGDDAAVHLWRLAPGHPPRPAATLSGPRGSVIAVAISPDGTLLAAASDDHHVWLWNISDPTTPTPAGGLALDGSDRPVKAVAFSPDGRTLAAGGEDKTVRLWDLTDPHRPIPLGPPLTGPTNAIYWLAFSPSTTTTTATAAGAGLLAAANGDGSVALWDIHDRDHPEAYASLTALPGQLWYVSFTPDGRGMAAGSATRRVVLWDIDPDVVARRLCAVVGDVITPAEWAQYVPGLPYQPPC